MVITYTMKIAYFKFCLITLIAILTFVDIVKSSSRHERTPTCRVRTMVRNNKVRIRQEAKEKVKGFSKIKKGKVIADAYTVSVLPHVGKYYVVRVKVGDKIFHVSFMMRNITDITSIRMVDLSGPVKKSSPIPIVYLHKRGDKDDKNDASDEIRYEGESPSQGAEKSPKTHSEDNKPEAPEESPDKHSEEHKPEVPEESPEKPSEDSKSEAAEESPDIAPSEDTKPEEGMESPDIAPSEDTKPEEGMESPDIAPSEDTKPEEGMESPDAPSKESA